MPVLCTFIQEQSPQIKISCNKRASYGYKDTNIKERCGTHKTSTMVNLNCPLCDICGTQASYGFPKIEGNIETGKKIKCGKHKTSIMIDLNNPLCDVCGKQATFGFKDSKSKKAIKCIEHKTSDMIDVKHKICEQCDERAYWGLPNKQKTRCMEHKSHDMVRDKDKECISPGCNTKPIFGKELGVPTHCDLHKDPSMFDVVNKKCLECPTRPTYNYKGLKADYCTLHKKKTMVNVKDKLCEDKECIKRACFGLELKKPTHCLMHKTSSMYNVVTIPCENCKIHQPVYGKPGTILTHCVGCRLPGMIRRSKTKCKSKNCTQPALYGSKGIANHCEIHKKSDELNYVERPCSKCNLLMILDKEDVCEFCNPEIFKSAKLEKQKSLFDYLDKYICEENILFKSTDTIIDKGNCGDERPDRIYELCDKIIIVECDEHQHKDRPCLCEQTRMVNICQSFMSEAPKPLYFIRFNPDDYKPGNGEDMIDIKYRYKYITSLIKDFILESDDKIPKALLSVCYLYFDDWIEDMKENLQWTSLLDFEK
jgi:hypothetical protein